MSDHTSPIADVNYNTLDELFSRDPLHLSDQDITAIVRELRSRRAKWLLEESAPKKEKIAKKVAVDLTKELGL